MLLPSRKHLREALCSGFTSATGCAPDEVDTYLAKADQSEFTVKGETADLMAKPLSLTFSTTVARGATYILETLGNKQLVVREKEGRLEAVWDTPTYTIRLGASTANAQKATAQSWIAQQISNKTLGRLHPRSARVKVTGAIGGHDTKPHAVLTHMLKEAGQAILDGASEDPCRQLEELFSSPVVGTLDVHLEPVSSRPGSEFIGHWRSEAAANAIKKVGQLLLETPTAWLKITSLDAYPDGDTTTSEQRAAWSETGVLVKLQSSPGGINGTYAREFADAMFTSSSGGYNRLVRNSAYTFARCDPDRLACLQNALQQRQNSGILLPTFVGRDGEAYGHHELEGDEVLEILYYVPSSGGTPGKLMRTAGRWQ
ncbi:hypothetical protein GPECTOR_971g236 [Gonium pectorale]|uniref:Uncharacterized protein n=1 Tax=Gonium pectorale TaxID=33097 RepID=A0A150FTX0_GONPE|nr:hypothetical protein GPECTOR_971g236 [Gonium pectorale]|eukprot:KXZ41018.1 hypothetical protein GPECTOR_971g236 [Gonium pectorale]